MRKERGWDGGDGHDSGVVLEAAGIIMMMMMMVMMIRGSGSAVCSFATSFMPSGIAS